MKTLPFHLDELSVAERVELASDLWDSIIDVPGDAFLLSDADRAELDRRLAAHAADPAASIPWPAIRDEILSGFKQNH